MASLLLLLACTGASGGKADDAEDRDDSGEDDYSVFELPECGDGLVIIYDTVLFPNDDVVAALAAAEPGDVIALEGGVYDLSSGEALEVDTPGVTLISPQGDAILDGFDATAELVSIGADDVTLIGLTLARSYGPAIHIVGAQRARMWGVTVEDAGGAGVQVSSSRGGYADDGLVACSHLTRATTCEAGIDAVQAEGWRVADTTIDQAGCDEPAIRFWTGSKDTIIERNVVSDAPQGIVLGDVEYGEGDERIYEDATCPDTPLVGHYGGVVRNNVLFEAGVRVELACGTEIVHNTLLGGTVGGAFSEAVGIRNNLATVSLADGATVEGNLATADVTEDGHLEGNAAAIDAGVTLAAGLCDEDIDGDARDDVAPDVGADELR